MNARPDSLTSERGGFTLIELIVVITVLGILASVAAPSLEGISPKYRLRSAARTVGGEIHVAHSMASTVGKTYAMRYDLDEGFFWIVLPPGEEDDPDLALEDREHLPKVELPNFITIAAVLLPGGTEVNDGTIDVIFDTATSEGSHIIYLRNEDDALLCVKFNALLGIVDYSSEEEQFAEF